MAAEYDDLVQALQIGLDETKPADERCPALMRAKKMAAKLGVSFDVETVWIGAPGDSKQVWNSVDDAIKDLECKE